MVNRLPIFISLFIIVSLIGCGTLLLVDKKCFDISNELKLFPGSVGEIITFKSSILEEVQH